MNNFAESEVFDGWVDKLGKTSLTVQELHGKETVPVEVPRPEGFVCHDGRPVSVLHMHDDEGHEIVSLYQAS